MFLEVLNYLAVSRALTTFPKDKYVADKPHPTSARNRFQDYFILAVIRYASEQKKTLPY